MRTMRIGDLGRDVVNPETVPTEEVRRERLRTVFDRLDGDAGVVYAVGDIPIIRGERWADHVVV